MKPIVSVVLGSYNRKLFLEKTIASVRASEVDFNYEIIVVDGGSDDGSIEWLVKQKDIITIVQHNRGEFNGQPIERRSWGYFMNLAFKAAQGKYVLMISDDCLVHPNAMADGVAFAEKELSAGEKLGAVPFYWRNWPEMEQYWVGRILGDHYSVNHGFYLKEALENVGFIEEEELFFYHADGDLCLKIIQAGYEVMPCRSCFIEHYSHANLVVRASNHSTQKQDKEAYLSRWRNIYYFDDKYFGAWEYLSSPPEIDVALAKRNWQSLYNQVKAE